jgi:hypothetical protein
MIPSIALSTPRLGDYNGEPMISCLYEILPTGSMLQSDQIMRGRIFRPAVLASDLPTRMVAAAEPQSEVMCDDTRDIDSTETVVKELNEAFIFYLVRLGLWEESIYAPGSQPGSY